MRTFAVLPLLIFPVMAWADCTQHFEAWAQTLHPRLELDDEYAVCKVNPGNAGQILAALPFIVEVNQYGSIEYSLEFLIADSATGAIIAQRYQEPAFISDAIRLTGLQLDTARYQLKPGLRAFGVRISYKGSSNPDPYSSENLTLYLQDGEQLRRVMSNLIVGENRGEWDTNCAGEFNEITRTLSIGNPGKDGFSSLQITEKSTDRQNIAKSEHDCEQVVAAAKTKTYTLNYSGDYYMVPLELEYK